MTQKEQFTLLGDDGRPSTFAPLLLSCLSLANSLELESIKLGFNQEESLLLLKLFKVSNLVLAFHDFD